MQLRDEAFVLRTRVLGDADLIVSLLARQHGHIRGVARSAQRSRKRFGGLLEPMTRVQASWTVKEGRDLHRIDQLEGAHSFAPMQADPLIQAVCAVVVELSEAFGSEGSIDDREFRLLAAVLGALEAGGQPALLLRYFEFWTLRLHGLLADPEQCALCGAQIERGGARSLSVADGFRCARCHAEPGEALTQLNSEEGLWLDRLQRIAPERLPAAHGAVRNGGSLERLFRRSLEGFAERRFRSYRHVHAFSANREDS